MIVRLCGVEVVDLSGNVIIVGKITILRTVCLKCIDWRAQLCMILSAPYFSTRGEFCDWSYVNEGQGVGVGTLFRLIAKFNRGMRFKNSRLWC
jgi:hypothetical protein